jgi:peptidyl-prolyl cis-trans isomerase C
MKYLFALSALTLCAYAQPPTIPVPVPMPPANISAETVVAKAGAKPITAADVRKILASLPSDLQGALMQNPKNALQSILLMQYLTNEAEKAQLENKSPYKEQLAMQRMQLLSQARATNYSEQVDVSEADQHKRYESDKSKFDQVKIHAIFVAFADPQTPAPMPESGQAVKTLTEAEAKAKAEALVKQARAGADFSDLAKKNSDDKMSAAKGGEYGKIARGDKIPDEIKTPLFALKAGQITDPLKQSTGFFILKADEIISQPFKDVQPQIITEMKQERFQEWMQALQKQFEVTIENQTFFPKKPAAGGPTATVTPVN